MLKKLLIKIFIFIFTLTSLLSFSPTKIVFSTSLKTYSVPIKLSTFSNFSRSLPTNLALVKTAIIKETTDSSILNISFETKEIFSDPNYILDINIYDNNQLKAGKFFYRYFDEKSKTYIHQVQFERKSKKENEIKVNILTNNKEKTSADIVIQLDWNKAKELNTKKFAKTNSSINSSSNLYQNSSIIYKASTSAKENNLTKQIIESTSVPSNTVEEARPITDSTINKSISNPARMQDYINHFNNIKNNLQPSPAITSNTQANKIEEVPEEILNEEKEKNINPPILRTISDFFSPDTITKSEGSYVTDISSNHLNPLTAKLANENSKDENLIKILSRNIITPTIESKNNLKEILRQESDLQEKKWARAGLTRKEDKLYATVRLHLANHITRSQEEGPFFKVLQENGQYELVPATEAHLNITKEGEAYADYTFEVPRENFSAMVQVNIASLNKTINFFLENNPKSIKKGTMHNTEQNNTQPASPLLKTIILALVLLIVLIIPLLVIKRKRQLEEDEYEDDEDEYY